MVRAPGPRLNQRAGRTPLGFVDLVLGEERRRTQPRCSARTSGNPFETVEMLNALRRDGVLTAGPAGWRWDSAAVRAHLDWSEVAGLLAARVDALPSTSRRLADSMACLGGRAELTLLQAATGESAAAVDQMLAPALDEGRHAG